MILRIISLLFLVLSVSNAYGANQVMPDIRLVCQFSDTDQLDSWVSRLSTLEPYYSTLEISLLIPEPDTISGRCFIASNYGIDIPISSISVLKILDGVRLKENSLNELPNFPNLRKIVFLPTFHATVSDLQKICDCKRLESLKISVNDWKFEGVLPAFPSELKELEISINEKWENNTVSAASKLLHLEIISFGDLNDASIEALFEKIVSFKKLKILKFEGAHQWQSIKIKHIIDLAKKFGGYTNLRFFNKASGNFNFRAVRNPDEKDRKTTIVISMTDLTCLEETQMRLEKQGITGCIFDLIE